MIENLTFEEIIMAVGGITVLVTGVFYKLDLIHFGKSKGCVDIKRNKCPDPACQERQAQLANDLGEMKPRLRDMHGSIKFIEGWVQGQKNSKNLT